MVQNDAFCFKSKQVPYFNSYEDKYGIVWLNSLVPEAKMMSERDFQSLAGEILYIQWLIRPPNEIMHNGKGFVNNSVNSNNYSSYERCFFGDCIWLSLPLEILQSWAILGPCCYYLSFNALVFVPCVAMLF